MLRYHVIVFDRFCWSWSFPQAVSTMTNCDSLPATWKCNNLREHGHPYELPDSWSPWPNLVDYKIWAICLPDKSAECGRFDLRQHLIDMWDICFRLSLVSWHLISQDSVATPLKCGWIFSDYFITRLLLSRKVKIFENRRHLAKFLAEYGALFLMHRVITFSVHLLATLRRFVVVVTRWTWSKKLLYVECSY